MRASLLLVGLLAPSSALRLPSTLSLRPRQQRHASPLCCAAAGRAEKIEKLGSSLQQLEAAGVQEEVLQPLRQELADLKTGLQEDAVASLKQELADLKADMASEAPEALSPPPPLSPPPAPPPPPQPAFDPLPSVEAFGVDGQRCAVLFYAYDGPVLVEGLLETFEDEAAEFASCGCALVAVRRVSDAGDRRKAGEYEARFPSFNFVDGLDGDTLVETRRALGVEADWFSAERSLYYAPRVVLLEPDGGVRMQFSAKGLSATQLLGQALRELHMAVPIDAADPSRMSAAEAEANKFAAYDETVAWERVLEEDESLRMPTRSWFDGLLTPARGADRPLLAGVDAAALPGAIDRFLAEGDEEGGEEEDDEGAAEALVSADGVTKAPAWYAKAKRTAEKKQARERELWNGTAPSATPGPIPLGPKGARLAPMQNYTVTALQEAGAQQRRLVQAFYEQFDVDENLRFLPGDAAAAANAAGGVGGASSAGGAGDDASRSAATESALTRAQMLALGLQRSAGTGAQGAPSTRRLRLLRELDLAVRELERDGFRDTDTGAAGAGAGALAPLKAQLRESYAAAPPEFVEEQRRADPFNAALPRLSLAEIAAEFLALAETGVGRARGAAPAPDFGSLNPNRKRGPREQGNKIEIKKPAGGARGGGDDA